MRAIASAAARGMALDLWRGSLLPSAAWRPTRMLDQTGYISIDAVTATIGSALTAGHFWKSAKSNQKRFAPTLGTSLTLGVPVIRQGFGGPPPRAIHGAGRLNRHPCRFTPQIPVRFRPACLTGRLRSKSRSKTKAQRPDSRLEWCGAKATANAVHDGLRR